MTEKKRTTDETRREGEEKKKRGEVRKQVEDRKGNKGNIGK